jgi:hypothetical protein
VGILGLVQLLYLHNHHKRNAERVYRLSRHRVQEFPLAPLSINITMATLTVRVCSLICQCWCCWEGQSCAVS